MRIEINSFQDKVILANDGVYKFKFHHVTGPSIFFEITFRSTTSKKSTANKYIEFESNENVLEQNIRDFYEELIVTPIQKGIVRFKEYLTEVNRSIESNIKLEMIEFVNHPIDTKPIGSELGIMMLLAKIFNVDHPIIENRKIDFYQIKNATDNKL
jgi:hypothetical protein